MLELKTNENDPTLIAEIGFINYLIASRFNAPTPFLKVNVEIIQSNNTGVNGAYNNKKKMISLYNTLNVNTLYHEVSHAIDFELFRSMNFSKIVLAYEQWKQFNYQVKELYPLVKLNFLSQETSAYLYCNFKDELTLEWQYKMYKKLHIHGEYWTRPEEIFARTMEVWFYNESQIQRGIANHVPTLFNIFPNNKNIITNECSNFINNFLVRIRNI